mgnify:CR=1 FL=1
MEKGVLSRKQLYRRAITKNVNNNVFDYFNDYLKDIPEEDFIPYKNNIGAYNFVNKYYENMNKYDINKYYKKERFHIKKVNFQKEVRVILIPQLAEYEKAGLTENLWYSQDDYFNFHNEYEKYVQNNNKYNTI